MARDIVVDRDDFPVEDRIGLAVIHALRQHCAVRGADDDGAERIERLALAAAIASRIAASCVASGMASRSSAGADAELAGAPPTLTAAPIRLANVRRDSAHFFNGKLDSVNLGFVDGHVVTSRPGQIAARFLSSTPDYFFY